MDKNSILNSQMFEQQKSFIKLCHSKQEFFTVKIAPHQKFKQDHHQRKPSSSHVLLQKADLNNLPRQSTAFPQQFKNSLNTTAQSKIQLVDLLKFKKKKGSKKISDDTKIYRRESYKRSISLMQNFTVIPKLIVMSRFQQTDKISLEDFQLLQKVGEGTYSQVYKVIHKKTYSIYALKMLSKQRMKRLNVEQNVVRQIKIQNYLNHQNLVQLYGYFDDEKNVYLICQYCTNGNCFNLINHYKKQLREEDNFCADLTEISKIVYELCSAVNAMHDNNIMHRDIKPQNILLTIGQNVKLCDFGWAIYNPQNNLRKTFCGTPLYLAPQLVQHCQYTDTVDVWAIGILTFELVTGQLPFRIRQIKQLQKIVKQEVNYQDIQNEAVKSFIKQTLQKQGERRPTVQQLLHHGFLKMHQQRCQSTF